MKTDELTVVVVAGAGARGAYEAGALAALLPKLSPNGLGSTILLGTSAGAINVALWASRARLGADLRAVGEQVKNVWRGIHREAVYRVPVWEALKLASGVGLDAGRELAASTASIATAPLREAAELVMSLSAPAFVHDPAKRVIDAVDGLLDAIRPAAGHPMLELPGLLDTHPLEATANARVDFDALRANVDSGALGGVGIVATSCPMDASGGRTRLFLHTRSGLIPGDEEGSSIDYVLTDRINAQHVLASAAIPLAFPSIRIDEPAPYAGWYTDGGVRLNAPIEPAIKLGATRIIVISSHAAEYPPMQPATDAARPELLDIAAQSIHAVLADGMIEDLRSLRRVNKMVEDARKQGATLKSERERTYRHIDVLVVSPPNGLMSPLAEQASLPILKRPSIDAVLLRLLSLFGRGGGRNELLSYLLFEPEFFVPQFELGATHALAALKAQPGFV